MEQSLFVTDEDELSEESWRLLLRQKSEMQLYKEKQREILEDIFK